MQKYLIVFLIAILAACSMPETKMYSISMSAAGEKRAVRTAASLGIIVHASRYLTQPYIASRVSPYQLDIARYSRWESPPDQMVKDTLRESLSSSGIFRDVSTYGAAAPGAYVLDVELRKFERSGDGPGSSAEIEMDATLSSPEGGEIYHGSIAKKATLADSSFLGLAKALSTMLADGESEITSGISRALPAGK